MTYCSDGVGASSHPSRLWCPMSSSTLTFGHHTCGSGARLRAARASEKWRTAFEAAGVRPPKLLTRRANGARRQRRSAARHIDKIASEFCFCRSLNAVVATRHPKRSTHTPSAPTRRRQPRNQRHPPPPRPPQHNHRQQRQHTHMRAPHPTPLIPPLPGVPPPPRPPMPRHPAQP
eukprot:537989-Prymnesium_polylepis.1